MVGPDGSRYPSDGTFREVVEPERLVFRRGRDGPPMIERSETNVTFNDLGDDRTEMTLDVTMVCSDELVPMAKQGWGSQVEKLDGFLAQR